MKRLNKNHASGSKASVYCVRRHDVEDTHLECFFSAQETPAPFLLYVLTSALLMIMVCVCCASCSVRLQEVVVGAPGTMRCESEMLALAVRTGSSLSDGSGVASSVTAQGYRKLPTADLISFLQTIIVAILYSDQLSKHFFAVIFLAQTVPYRNPYRSSSTPPPASTPRPTNRVISNLSRH